MNQDDVIRIGQKAAQYANWQTSDPYDWKRIRDERFAALVVENFLQQSGEYLTNDASREAAIKEAVEAEREGCAKVCEKLPRKGYWITKVEAAAAIRARGESK